MAEKPSNNSKRPRDGQLPSSPASEGDAGEAFKRQRPYDDILSLLDEEEDEPHQDVSYLMTTLQQEISSPPSTGPPSPSPAADGASKVSDREEDEGERVMKHLLEASDDELGLPNTTETGGESGPETLDRAAAAKGVAELCDGGLWELEDEAANYYTMVQSEFFMM